jgi:probable F420-dependent oxidoreductase
MDFGIDLTCPTAEFTRRVAPEVEKLGFRTAYSGDHVVGFESYDSKYPYFSDGQFKQGSSSGLHSSAGAFGGIDAFQKLLLIASCTTTLRVGTGVMVLPQRNPVYAAQQATTLDIYSGGRFDFGIGVGWAEEEYNAVGVPFARRGKRCSEAVEVMKALWTQDPSEYSGEIFQLPRCRQFPKPLQGPHPPLLFGGNGDAALRRVADLGDGWFGWSVEPDAVAERVGVLHTMLAERGRPPESARIVVGHFGVDLDRAKVDAYAAAGVDELSICVIEDRRDAEAMVAAAHDIADRLM